MGDLCAPAASDSEVGWCDRRSQTHLSRIPSEPGCASAASTSAADTRLHRGATSVSTASSDLSAIDVRERLERLCRGLRGLDPNKAAIDGILGRVTRGCSVMKQSLMAFGTGNSQSLSDCQPASDSEWHGGGATGWQWQATLPVLRVNLCLKLPVVDPSRSLLL